MTPQHRFLDWLSESPIARAADVVVVCTGYGVGWRIYNHNGLSGYGHTGGSVGGITAFRIYPSKKLILVLLSNSSNTNYGNASDSIASWFLNSESIK